MTYNEIAFSMHDSANGWHIVKRNLKSSRGQEKQNLDWHMEIDLLELLSLISEPKQ